MPRENESEFIHKVLKGNIHAVVFCQTIFRVSQVIDDLIDRDKDVDNRTIMNTFWTCIIELPNNPFYRKHFDFLNPLLQSYFNDWMDSYFLETTKSDHHQNIAFGLRASIGNILVQCAFLIGGYHWMREISIEVRDHIFEESLLEYKEGL